MAQLHPYEMVYFNALSGSQDTIRQRYELDYWGLGFHAMLKHLLKIDSREQIAVGVSNFSGIYAKQLLSPEEKARIRIVGKMQKADYFISNFRWHPEEYPLPKVYELEVDNVVIGAIYAVPEAAGE